MLGAIKQMHNAARVCCAEAPHVMLSSVCVLTQDLSAHQGACSLFPLAVRVPGSVQHLDQSPQVSP